MPEWIDDEPKDSYVPLLRFVCTLFHFFFPYRYISFQDENNVTSRDEDVLITPLSLITLYHISQCCGPVANCQTVIGIAFLHSKLHLDLYMVFNYFSVKCSIFPIAKHRLGKWQFTVAMLKDTIQEKVECDFVCASTVAMYRRCGFCTGLIVWQNINETFSGSAGMVTSLYVCLCVSKTKNILVHLVSTCKYKSKEILKIVSWRKSTKTDT